jgi:hypothetical protein
MLQTGAQEYAGEQQLRGDRFPWNAALIARNVEEKRGTLDNFIVGPIPLIVKI